MRRRYEQIMQEVDRRMSAIDLNGKLIIIECKAIVIYLREKLANLKVVVQATPFSDETEEIDFFKHYKPMLLGRLIYFHEILRIESRRPLGEDTLDGYYEKQQEEQKLFFDRHVAFFQYYRSAATYMDHYYFLRGKQQENIVGIDVCHWEDDLDFSTGYDHLAARILAMEMLYAYLVTRRRMVLQDSHEGQSVELLKVKDYYKWTGKIVDLVEIIYALDTQKCIGNGKVNIEELATYMGQVFGVEIKNCFKSYNDIKRRKDNNRTYFLNELSDGLNNRMTRDDEKERQRRK